MMTIEQLLSLANDYGASDVHIVSGMTVRGRVNGVLRDLTVEKISASQCEIFARQLAGEEYKVIESIGELDTSLTFDSFRARVNAFRSQGNISIAIRMIKSRIPTPEQLGLPQVIRNFTELSSGLILVTGETGTGKSTTMASLLDNINHTKSGHIITLEDPIEYVYTPDRCIVNQRELGHDTLSFADALRAALREDPDYILVGEMRDTPTMEAALTAAETGHLVFSTLHTATASDTIDRIVGSFSEGMQRQVRMQLAGTLRAVVSQKLLPTLNGKGRQGVFEIMVVNTAIKNLIREGKNNQLDSFISIGAQDGSVALDSALVKLMRDGVISREVAVRNARSPERFPKF